MSIESRSPLRALRRPTRDKEPDRPDYSEPDFGSWSARLDNFVPASKVVVTDVVAPGTTAAPAAAPAAAAPAAAVAVAEAPAASPVAAPVAEAAPEDHGSLQGVLDGLLQFDGAMSVALVDSQTGMILGKAGSGINMELAAAGASVILRARLQSIKTLGTKDKIEDLLISLSSQVQIIHPLPTNPSLFTYIIGDKSKSSLAMARYKANEADLQIQL